MSEIAQSLFIALLAALAGGVGAVVRFVVDGTIMARFARCTQGAAFPSGILAVNLSGSLAIGLLSGFVAGAHPLFLVAGVGLLGGYTTFSTASYDTVQLLRRGRVAAALGNSLGQLIASVLAAALGFWFGGLF